MKRLYYAKEFRGADGQPFVIVDPDVKVQREAREKAQAEKKDKWPAPTIDCDFAQVMIWFMNHLPFNDEVGGEGKPKTPRKLTHEDAGNAYAVIKAFRAVEDGGTVELEDPVYSWLLEILKLDGIEAFRPLATQAIVTERLSDIIREEPKK